MTNHRILYTAVFRALQMSITNTGLVGSADTLAWGTVRPNLSPESRVAAGLKIFPQIFHLINTKYKTHVDSIFALHISCPWIETDSVFR